MTVIIIYIKLVDGRGRTVCRLSKRTYYDDGHAQETEPWGIEGKPWSKKRPEGLPFQEGRIARAAQGRHGDQRYLEVRGLTLNMAKVAPVLDRIATAKGLIDPSGAVVVTDMDAATLTTDQLRSYVGSKW